MSDLDFLSSPECEPLSREEEQAIARRVRAGDVEARNRLVMANARFVVKIAQRHQGRGVELPELVHGGLMGLMTAAERYDPDKGFTFCTFAYWFATRGILNVISQMKPEHEQLPDEEESEDEDAPRWC